MGIPRPRTARHWTAIHRWQHPFFYQVIDAVKTREKCSFPESQGRTGIAEGKRCRPCGYAQSRVSDETGWCRPCGYDSDFTILGCDAPKRWEGGNKHDCVQM